MKKKPMKKKPMKKNKIKKKVLVIQEVYLQIKLFV